jgi:hypothetical protein
MLSPLWPAYDSGSEATSCIESSLELDGMVQHDKARLEQCYSLELASESALASLIG